MDIRAQPKRKSEAGASRPSSPARTVERARTLPIAVQPTPKQSNRPNWMLGLGPAFTFGHIPDIAHGGLRLQAGLRRPTFWVTVDGRFDFAEIDNRTPYTQATLYLGTAAGCYRKTIIPAWGGFFACGLASAGALRIATTGIKPSYDETFVHLDAGTRAGLEFMPLDSLSLLLLGDAVVPLLPLRMVRDGVDVWNSSTIAATIGFAACVVIDP